MSQCQQTNTQERPFDYRFIAASSDKNEHTDTYEVTNDCCVCKFVEYIKQKKKNTKEFDAVCYTVMEVPRCDPYTRHVSISYGLKL